MKKLFHTIITFLPLAGASALALVAAVSCAHKDLPPAPVTVSASDTELSIVTLSPAASASAAVSPSPSSNSSSLSMSGETTKGAGSLSTETLRTRGFSLFAWWTPEGDYFGGITPGTLWLDGTDVSFVAAEGDGRDRWTCSPAAWWPLGAGLSFFAYAPAMDASGGMLSFPESGTAGMPAGRFTQESDVVSQEDFLIAPPVLDRRKDQGAVPMTFNHALTKVLFYFNAVGDIYEGDTHVFKVKSLTLRNLVGSNRFVMGGTNGFRWDTLPRDDVSSRTASYELSIAGGTLRDAALPLASDRESETGLGRYDCVNDHETGQLYLLPQPMTLAAEARVVFAAYLYDDVTGEWVEDPEFDYEPVVISLPEQTVWEPGKTVCYSASVDISHLIDIQFTVTVMPWEVEESAAVSFPER